MNKNINIDNIKNNIQNKNNYFKPLTEKEKQKIRESTDFSEEKFYRLYFGWSTIFPELSQEEVETITWKTYAYYNPLL